MVLTLRYENAKYEYVKAKWDLYFYFTDIMLLRLGYAYVLAFYRLYDT